MVGPKGGSSGPTCPGPAKLGEGTGQREADWDATGRKPPSDLFCSWAQDTHSA